MKVLLTGSSGFIGSRVAGRLLDHGFDVVRTARTPERLAELTALGHAAVFADVLQPQTVCDALEGVDAVVNLAFAAEDPGSEMLLAERLTDALAGTGKALVWTSGVAVVGPSGPDVFDETAPLVLDGPFGWRARGEQIVLQAAERGVRTLVIRPPIVYADGHAGVLDLFAAAVQGGDAVPYPGAGDARWATVDVDDLADLYVKALSSGVAGSVYIAASGQELTMRELAELASERLGLGGRTVSIPLSDMIDRVGPMAHLLASPGAFSGARARRELEWSPSAAPLGSGDGGSAGPRQLSNPLPG